MATLAEAEAAKRKLSMLLDGDEGVTGVGITSVRGGFGVRVNLAVPNVSARVPQKVDGVPVVTRVTGRIRSHGMLQSLLRSH